MIKDQWKEKLIFSMSPRLRRAMRCTNIRCTSCINVDELGLCAADACELKRLLAGYCNQICGCTTEEPVVEDPIV